MQFSTILTLIASAALFTTSNAAPLKTRSSGQATFYEVGLGSCGKTNKNTQMVAALSSSIMKKSYCGKSITLKGGKGSVTVQVVDTVSWIHKFLI
jgi:ribosomal protein S27E